jgi:N-terminal domain of anti-restriction factor ArdC
MGGHIMNADDLKKITTESLKQLAQLLEQGHSDRLTSLLKTMARFHRYSLNNVCLIVAQRPTATRVAGYHTWRTIGRFVRKGEKGIAILAPILRRRRDETDEEESRVIAGFRTAYVFDVLSRDSATRSRQRRRGRRGRHLHGPNSRCLGDAFEQDCRVCSKTLAPFWKPEASGKPCGVTTRYVSAGARAAISRSSTGVLMPVHTG